MNEIDKIQFKLELELNLKSPEDIKKWGLDTLEIDPSNELSLDICFLSNNQQILEYFNNIPNNNLEIDLRKKIASKLLNVYILRLHTDNSIELIQGFFQKILTLAQYIEDDNLYDLADSYDDKLYFALEGFGELTPEEVWPAFLIELYDWISPI